MAHKVCWLRAKSCFTIIQAWKQTSFWNFNFCRGVLYPLYLLGVNNTTKPKQYDHSSSTHTVNTCIFMQLYNWRNYKNNIKQSQEYRKIESRSLLLALFFYWLKVYKIIAQLTAHSVISKSKSMYNYMIVWIKYMYQIRIFFYQRWISYRKKTSILHKQILTYIFF